MGQHSIVQVAVDVPLPGTFSYLTQLSVMIGQRVAVSFDRAGFVAWLSRIYLSRVSSRPSSKA